jgi:hypothetical protein
MLGNLGGVLQLVGDRGNQPVSDGVLRIDSHADVTGELGVPPTTSTWCSAGSRS